MKFQSNSIFNGTITANSVADAGTNTDKFLVLNSSGVVTYRTAAELYADLGVGSSSAAYTAVLKHPVKAGEAINKGQAVYVSSADGTNMIVTKASNATEATSSKTIGLLETTLANNGIGNVITEGLLAGLDTTGATNAGDPVWLGTGGNLIYGLANKPYAPAHLVFIGIVTRINANNGEIFVKVQNGFELKEIHDVDLITTTPVNGHILGYNGTLWVNKTIAGWLGFTPANAATYVPYTGATTSLNMGTNDVSSCFYYAEGDASAGAIYLKQRTSVTNSATGYSSLSAFGGYSFQCSLNNGTLNRIFRLNAFYLDGTNIRTYILPNADGTLALTSDIPSLTGYVPTSRTITINGTAYDLSADRSWTVSSMIYPGAGIAVSTGTAWGTSITDNSANWNTAYTNRITSLTVTGSSGAATLVSNTLNIPTYTLAGLGGVATSRTLTINGTAYDLSADRSWTIDSTSASTRTIQKFTATAGQNSFTITGGYTVGMVDVYMNGVKLDNATDFTAVNGTTIGLTTGALLNSIIEVYKFGSQFIPNNALRVVTSFTATAAQTTFTVNYSVGLIDVFYNGSCLAQSEYTAINGTSIILATACQVNDIVVVYAYSYSVGAYSGIGGSGTANYLPKFTASSTIGDSAITDNGTTVTLVSRALSGTSATFSSTITQGAIAAPSYGGGGSGINLGYFNLQNVVATQASYANNVFYDGAVWKSVTSTISYAQAVRLQNGNIDFHNASVSTSGQTMSNWDTTDVKMRITLAGNVGIGTSSPSGQFQVQATNSGIVFDTATAYTPRIKASGSLSDLQIESVGNGGNLILSAPGTTSIITMSTNAAERMRITSGGNVGINITPVTSAGNTKTLQIGATTIIQSVVNNQSAWLDNAYYDGTSAWKYVTTNNAAGMRVGAAAAGEITFHCAASGSAGASISTWDTTDIKMRIATNGAVTLNSWVYGNTVNTSPRTLYIESGTGSLGGISSIRASKKNIKNVSNVDWLYKLNPVTFNYRKKDDQGNYTEEIHDYINYGLIAEDTAPIIDFIINYNEKEDGTKEMAGIEYPRLIIPMLKAIQEMNTKIIELEKIVATK